MTFEKVEKLLRNLQSQTKPIAKHRFFFSINATKTQIHTNIDKIMKIKIIKNIQTSTNT